MSEGTEGVQPDRPRVRPIEAIPLEVEGERQFALRDPAGWTDRVMIVTPETLFVISCLDGSRDLRDVQSACFQQFQEIVAVELIGGVVDALDEGLLLDSEKFRRHRAKIEADYLSSSVRPAAHAGSAYEGDPDKLKAGLDRLLAAGGAAAEPIPGGDLSALIAPHIDLHRGGAGYAAAYGALGRRCRSDLFVVLGTVHAAPPEPYLATRKAYGTPLGPVETDDDFISLLAKRYGARLFDGESAHRTEHSIEFQALFLRHAFPDKPIRIVPILCSSFHEEIESGALPVSRAQVADFIGALRESLAVRPDACVIAAADLAHLGPRFGDEAPVDDETASWCAGADRLSLQAAAARDSGAFFRVIAEEGDRRRVCGISAIYTLLESLPPGPAGTLLHYGQALDEERMTFVSFASMAFTRAS
jgi:MEMO1 family protein